MKTALSLTSFIIFFISAEIASSQMNQPVAIYLEKQSNSQLWIQQAASSGAPRLAVLMLRNPEQSSSWGSVVLPHTVDVFSTHSVDSVGFGLFALRPSALGGIRLVADQSVYLAQALENGKSVSMNAVSTIWGGTPAARFEFESVSDGRSDHWTDCLAPSPGVSRLFRAGFEDQTGARNVEATVTSRPNGLNVLEIKAAPLVFPFLFQDGSRRANGSAQTRFEIVSPIAGWALATLRSIQTTVTLESEATTSNSMFLLCSSGPYRWGRRVSQMFIFVPGVRGAVVRLEEARQ